MNIEYVITFLIQGAALGITAAASPGPFQTFLISRSLSGGWRRGAPIAIVPLITDLPIILFALFLLGKLPPFFFTGIRFAGGAFVLYLAWATFKEWQSGDGNDSHEYASAITGLKRGILVNFLSPGPYLFWGLINGPILLTALRQSALHGAAFLFGFYGIFISSLFLLAILFHQARRFGSQVVRVLLLMSILILVVFGGILIWQGINGS